MSQFSQMIRFADWSPSLVPPVAAGVYAIWDDVQLIYCGMSGRSFKPEHVSRKKRHGLVTRLHSHASGRLSGDQFCVYVANRIVIPSLDASMLKTFAAGEMTLDALTRQYIRSHLRFQYAIADSGAEAFALERRCRRGEVFGVKPLLNPAN